MTRRSRCIQPALDEFDKKTLLTAGQLFAASRRRFAGAPLK